MTNNNSYISGVRMYQHWISCVKRDGAVASDEMLAVQPKRYNNNHFMTIQKELTPWIQTPYFGLGRCICAAKKIALFLGYSFLMDEGL